MYLIYLELFKFFNYFIKSYFISSFFFKNFIFIKKLRFNVVLNLKIKNYKIIFFIIFFLLFNFKIEISKLNLFIDFKSYKLFIFIQFLSLVFFPSLSRSFNLNFILINSMFFSLINIFYFISVYFNKFFYKKIFN